MSNILSELSVDLFAKKIGIPKDILLELTEFAPNLYTERFHPKKSGGFRTLEIPYYFLKKIQKSLLVEVFNKIPTHPKLFGTKRTSIKDAVQAHTKKEMVITMDIKNFFPSTKSYIIKNRLIKNGASAEIAGLLTRLITYKNHLPQGAPTSSCIARIVLHPLALEIESYLSNIPSADFSIYADDITLSGPHGIKRIKNSIQKLLSRYKYEINRSKVYIMNSNQDQVSLGLKLNHGIEATDKMLREIDKLEIQLPPDHPTLLGKKGWIKYITKIN